MEFIYSLLIHLGMIIWLTSAAVAMAARKPLISFSWVKFSCGIIGAVMVLPFILDYLSTFDGGKTLHQMVPGMALMILNLPAYSLTGITYDLVGGGLGAYILIYFLLFGFLGGWGIGLLVQGAMRIKGRRL